MLAKTFLGIRPGSAAVAIGLLVLLTAAAITSILPEQYASSARLAVENAGGQGVPSVHESDLSEMLLAPAILDPVIEELGLKIKWAQRYGATTLLDTPEPYLRLRKMTKVRHQRSPGLFEVRVSSEDPTEAAEIANKIADVFCVAMRTNASGLCATVVDRAARNFRPVSPNIPLGIAAGLALSVALGALAFVILDSLGNARNVAVLCAMIAGASGASQAEAAPYSDRFVWVFGWGLRRGNEVTEITGVLEKASKSGLNGAVLSASLDSLCKQPPDYFRRLDEVKQACNRLEVELIPAVFSVGYGGGTLTHNRHLAEGLPVEDAVFVADKEVARFVPDSLVGLINGGFEEFTNHRFKAFNFHDEPGVISFADTEVVHGGKASARLENFKAHPNGNARINQEVRVRPHRSYRVSVWVKTDGLKPVSGFRVTVLAQNRDLAPRTFQLRPTTDWRKLTMVFNSFNFESVRLYAGVWGGKEGKVWLDDWAIEEVGPINALRRPGTPVTVRSEDGRSAFDEGKDYAPLQDPGFSFWNVDRIAPPLRLLPDGRIREGQRLRVSWFHPMVIHESQVTVCMAEPELYENWEHEAKLLAEHLQPRRVILNMDEVRLGGTCRACRGQDMAKLLGECVTRQAQIVRRHIPNAQVYVWSDMFDPNHNARANYYLVDGDYTGSWKHIPKDIVIGVWGGAPREKSLRFFAEQSFETLVACYYDADDLEDVKGWLRVAGGLPRVRGFMYTPWQRKYDLLPAFGQMLTERVP